MAQLDQQIATLTERHDQTVDRVLAGLLSSTFVEHLQDRQAAVTELIDGVNQVLAQHPTGASATTLRLRRQAAAGHEAAFAVLTALESRPYVRSRPPPARFRPLISIEFSFVGCLPKPSPSILFRKSSA